VVQLASKQKPQGVSSYFPEEHMVQSPQRMSETWEQALWTNCLLVHVPHVWIPFWNVAATASLSSVALGIVT
jgi:hypothetical protein